MILLVYHFRDSPISSSKKCASRVESRNCCNCACYLRKHVQITLKGVTERNKKDNSIVVESNRWLHGTNK